MLVHEMHQNGANIGLTLCDMIPDPTRPFPDSNTTGERIQLRRLERPVAKYRTSHKKFTDIELPVKVLAITHRNFDADSRWRDISWGVPYVEYICLAMPQLKELTFVKHGSTSRSCRTRSANLTRGLCNNEGYHNVPRLEHGPQRLEKVKVGIKERHLEVGDVDLRVKMLAINGYPCYNFSE
jgi:hypothetical protein